MTPALTKDSRFVGSEAIFCKKAAALIFHLFCPSRPKSVFAANAPDCVIPSLSHLLGRRPILCIVLRRRRNSGRCICDTQHYSKVFSPLGICWPRLMSLAHWLSGRWILLSTYRNPLFWWYRWTHWWIRYIYPRKMFCTHLPCLQCLNPRNPCGADSQPSLYHSWQSEWLAPHFDAQPLLNDFSD